MNAANASLTPLLNETLMYADFHRKGATKENIVKVLCSFYSDDELKSAKSLLYKQFGHLNVLQNDTEIIIIIIIIV